MCGGEAARTKCTHNPRAFLANLEGGTDTPADTVQPRLEEDRGREGWLLGRQRALWPGKECLGGAGGFQCLANNGKTWKGQSCLPAQKPLPQRANQKAAEGEAERDSPGPPPKSRGICRYSLLPASPQVRGEGHDPQASRGISASPQGASGTYGDGGGVGSWLFLGWDYGGKGHPQPSGPPQG